MLTTQLDALQPPIPTPNRMPTCLPPKHVLKYPADLSCSLPACPCSFDPLGLTPKDDAAWKDLQTKELNNGRLAMIAIAGFVLQELALKQEIFEHLALRFEREAVLELDDIERDVGLPLTTL